MATPSSEEIRIGMEPGTEDAPQPLLATRWTGLMPPMRRRRAEGGAGYLDCPKLLAPAQRHDPGADSVDLSADQKVVRAQLHQIGLITFTFQMTSSIFQPVIGLYTDRKPKPYSLALGMAITLGGLVYLAFAPDYFR